MDERDDVQRQLTPKASFSAIVIVAQRKKGHEWKTGKLSLTFPSLRSDSCACRLHELKASKFTICNKSREPVNK
jgi:hypothetical protein